MGAGVGGRGAGVGEIVVCKEIETQIARGSGVLFGPLVASVRCMKKLVINEKMEEKKVPRAVKEIRRD